MATTIYNNSVNTIDGKSTTLGSYEGKVLMIVNVASKCGLTPQYEGLEKIYEHYKIKGFEVLGFPANEFAGQEPGTNQEIQDFCRSNFSVQFPLFEKIVVRGEGQHPLYAQLTTEQPISTAVPNSGFLAKLAGYGLAPKTPSEINWNFEKFLINRRGEVVQRFAPDMTPEDPTIKAAIERELAK